MSTVVAITSGKGGTGKTTLALNIAVSSFFPITLLDCDVDAADLHLLVAANQQDSETEPFISGFKAVVDPYLCTGCGRCQEVCRFHAVETTAEQRPSGNTIARIAHLACEGCGCCVDECPTGAISFIENTAGDLSVSPSRFGTLVHAQLHPGEGSSGKLVTKVREKAQEIAKREDSGLILIDGSPGIGCPVIASLTGTDAILIVTEPTVSGLHDLNRVADLSAYLKIPAYAVVNKCDIDLEMTEKITNNCRERDVEVLGRVPFDLAFVEALSAGVTVVEYNNSSLADDLRNIWSSLVDKVGKSGKGDQDDN